MCQLVARLVPYLSWSYLEKILHKNQEKKKLGSVAMCQANLYRKGILKNENKKKDGDVPAHLAQLDSVLLSGFLLPKRGQGVVLRRLDKTSS